MANQVDIIRDYYGRIVAKVEIDSYGNKTVRDFYGRILGYYNKRLNVTQNFFRQVIAKGDATGSLIKYD